MLRAGVNWSESGDPFRAGQEAAGKALEALGEKPRLAVAFCTVAYDTTRFLEGIREAAGDAPLIGSTSFTGVLTPAGFLHAEHGAGTVMLLAGEDMAFGVGAAAIGEEPEAAGEKAALAAVAQAGKKSHDPVAAFMLVAPPGAEERLIRGIERVVGRAPMIGGSAADNTLEGKWQELANGKALEGSVVVALIYSPRLVGVGYSGEFRPTAKRGVITKVRDRRTLAEIDGRKALEVYAEWRGLPIEDLEGGKLLVQSIQRPLGIVDVGGGHWWIRHPMNGNADGTIATGNDLAEGTVVTMMEATTEELVAAPAMVAGQAVSDVGGEVGAVIMAHCGGRALGLGPDRMGEVARGLKQALGDVPFVGYCTFGEQGFARWTANGAGGLMLSALAIGK